MNMKEIEVLSELDNYQSFLDAAVRLAYSPSVITKYVSNIEKELGVKLFSRGNKSNKFTLTQEGRVLIRDIHKLNMIYQHMMEMSKQLRGSFENVLRVGSQSRFGNLVERDILTSFLLQNSDAELERVKMSSNDLLKLLQAGKLDAMFMCVHVNAKIENYFQDMNEHSDLELMFLSTEREIYLGISDKYLPGVETEAKFDAFKEFSFAFPFPISTDENDSKAIDSFEQLARQSGFKLKTAYFGMNDNMIMKLATERPIAVTTTNIPARFEGIKFLRVSDWSSYTSIYFACLKSNRKKMLLNLKRSIAKHIKQAGTEE